MYFLLKTLKVVYVLTTPMPKLVEYATMEAIRIRANWENDDYICRGHILNGMSDSLFDVYTNVESAKELPVMEQYNELLRILGQYTKHGLKMDESISVSKESLRAQDSDKGNGKEVGGPSVNMIEEGKNKHNKQKKVKSDPMRKTVVLVPTRNQSWNVGSMARLVTSTSVVVKRTTQMPVVRERGLRTIPKTKVDAIVWWIDSGATTHVRKDRCWFKTFKRVEDGSVLYIGDEHFAPVHGKGSVALEFSSGKTGTLFNVLYVPKLRKNLVSSPVLTKCGYKQVHESDKYILSKSGVFVGFGYYNNGHVHYKRMLEMSKDDLIPAIDENLKKCTTCMLTKITKKPFQSITRKSVKLELIHSDLCDFHATPSLGNKKYVITFIDDASRFCYVYLLHAKDEALDKFRICKTKVELQQNDLIKALRTNKGGEYYDPIFFQHVGIIHETTAPYIPQQNGVAERKNRALKEMVNSCYLTRGCRAVVRLPDPKRKTLGEKGIDCIFVGYAEHSQGIIGFIPKDIIPNLEESQRDDHSDDVPSETPKPRRDPRTYNEAVQSRDAAFWKEAIDDEIGSIMENNTWVLSDLPPGCKPLGCKWIFKRKMKVDGTIDKFKARLVIQGFRQKEGIDYFDTYAPVARITTIRLLLALAAIHNLVIHQMDVKTTFLNGDLDEEVYMKQPEGFVMPGNEHKVCKLVKSLYGLKQAPKQWHQKFDEKFLSSRFSMKDIGEADIILGIEIKRENKGIVITQSHYIEKILKKFNHEDCSPVSYTNNPSKQHRKAITRVFKYLRGTKDYGLSYVGYPSVLEGYSDASWINHVEDSSSTSGWVFLLGGGAISWVSKKQTCITGSTMESEFVALAAARKRKQNGLRN
ncbi:zinc finger, CCHC-type containing protein [Tanacetum coccineum]|uniref:Zinc finger, CCHC-type containing protein n=1 Tax=Tanacetum coccineum TaxID=301880 RepID=A0ABQ5FHA3_9ASTR